MLYEVRGNVIEDEEYNIICHQTNCLGVMGKGIAKSIADKYPAVKHRNADYCRIGNPFGTILPVRVGPERICVNLYGQYNYGYNKQFTDYNMLRNALNMLADRLKKSSIPTSWKIAFPHGIGCKNAGGSWIKVKPLLEEFAAKVDQDVYIVKLPERKWEYDDDSRVVSETQTFENGNADGTGNKQETEY